VADSIGPYVSAAADLTEADFVAAHPEPVFLLAPLARATERTGEVTRISKRFANTAVVGFEVLPLRKRAGANQFKSMITLGRSSASDIELRAPEVSKSHAYVVVADDGAVQLTDAGSTNGTLVNGVKLAPKTTHRLAAGDKVSFGGAAAVIFHVPASFYVFLRSAAMDAR
jgi:pSer/pThr/pTyr-binding forkhead associated (FHA) protein